MFYSMRRICYDTGFTIHANCRNTPSSLPIYVIFAKLDSLDFGLSSNNEKGDTIETVILKGKISMKGYIFIFLLILVIKNIVVHDFI
jgi:hypothetical protein